MQGVSKQEKYQMNGWWLIVYRAVIYNDSSSANTDQSAVNDNCQLTQQREICFHRIGAKEWVIPLQQAVLQDPNRLQGVGLEERNKDKKSDGYYNYPCFFWIFIYFKFQVLRKY